MGTNVGTRMKSKPHNHNWVLWRGAGRSGNCGWDIIYKTLTTATIIKRMKSRNGAHSRQCSWRPKRVLDLGESQERLERRNNRRKSQKLLRGNSIIPHIFSFPCKALILPSNLSSLVTSRQVLGMQTPNRITAHTSTLHTDTHT